jgi:hypothetical protein
LRLNLFGPFHVFFCKLDRVLRVVLELNGAFVFVEILSIAKGICDFLISLLFPASRVTLYLRSVRHGFTDNLDPSVAAFAK